jgi:hypothetical protein
MHLQLQKPRLFAGLLCLAAFIHGLMEGVLIFANQSYYMRKPGMIKNSAIIDLVEIY